MPTFKPVAELSRKIIGKLPFATIFPFRTTSVVFLAVIGFFGAIAIAWFHGEKTTLNFFQQWHSWQDAPPFWLTAPQVDRPFLLFLPTIILFCITYGVMKLSPQPKPWSRTIVVGILLALTIRYILWRSLSTLNLSNPLDGIFSLALLVMEIVVIFGSTIQLYLMLTITDRRSEADEYSQAVQQRKYTPSVDILIPTYNEPDFVLRRTIIGCQALDYPNKNIYLLDDTQRPEIKYLTKELGCYYITRPDNRHAKAGNLNHAITKTTGELIVVFDADFIPTKNFLTRTIGFFQKEKMALVQTPQSFYNADPIARNLGIEDILPSEEEIFYRQIQPIKDGAGSVVCSGTSFVVRRSALLEVGCFVTDSISEDYYTGIRLSAKGYELVYLNENLSAGLAAESMAGHIIQRLRWARGTLQGFFIDSNPLIIRGLGLRQRLAHLEGYLTWFAIIPRLFFLLMPILYCFFSIKPLVVTMPEMAYLFLPYYLIQLTAFSWLYNRSRSIIFSDLYAIVSCFPLFITIVKVLLNPFGQGFKVTPKGLLRSRGQYNWKLAFPLVVFFIGTSISILQSLGIINSSSNGDISLVLLWNIYNLIVISVALLGLLDIPKPDVYEWLTTEQTVKLIGSDRTLEGTMTKLSEVGAEIEIKQPFRCGRTLILEIPEADLKLPGKLIYTNSTRKANAFLDFQEKRSRNENSFKIQIKFEQLDADRSRRLIEVLYCRPGQWKRRNSPGEWRSLSILLGVLLRPLIFWARSRFSQKTEARKANALQEFPPL
jgi:cellulose synthase (UDP-forming)